eukprot:TRINITY_DN13060_c0_g1_i1.p1 TRINITY_DN13060_c0_g1~~TRINITY_DN13060_c0_g1_i1.p1  ORF type:complete len:419 (+),score=111.40 TRINITY_DN13060_c0_g1_i1:126-1382(+)
MDLFNNPFLKTSSGHVINRIGVFSNGKILEKRPVIRLKRKRTEDTADILLLQAPLKKRCIRDSLKDLSMTGTSKQIENKMFFKRVIPSEKKSELEEEEPMSIDSLKTLNEVYVDGEALKVEVAEYNDDEKEMDKALTVAKSTNNFLPLKNILVEKSELVDFHRRHSDNATALEVAVKMNNETFVKFLLGIGATVDRSSDLVTLAINLKHKEVASIIEKFTNEFCYDTYYMTSAPIEMKGTSLNGMLTLQLEDSNPEDRVCWSDQDSEDSNGEDYYANDYPDENSENSGSDDSDDNDDNNNGGGYGSYKDDGYNSYGYSYSMNDDYNDGMDDSSDEDDIEGYARRKQRAQQPISDEFFTGGFGALGNSNNAHNDGEDPFPWLPSWDSVGRSKAARESGMREEEDDSDSDYISARFGFAG